MDVGRFDTAAHALLNSLGDRLAPSMQRAVGGLLFGGEWQFFIDVVAGTLSEDKTPISTAERDLLQGLLYAFEPDEIDPEDHQSILHRDEVMASLNVVV